MPGARVDDVVALHASAAPPADRGAGGREASVAQGDRRSVAVDVAVIVAHAHRPAARGRVAGDCDVTAQADQDAASRLGSDPSRRAVGRERLPGRSEVELDPCGDADRVACLVEHDPTPAGGASQAHDAAPVVVDRDQCEVARVAEGVHRVADRRVDGASGRPGRPHRRGHRLEQDGADADGTARCRVHRAQLRGGAEAAARAIDAGELVVQQRARRSQVVGVRDRHQCRRSERLKAVAGRACDDGGHLTSLPTPRRAPGSWWSARSVGTRTPESRCRRRASTVSPPPPPCSRRPSRKTLSPRARP